MKSHMYGFKVKRRKLQLKLKPHKSQKVKNVEIKSKKYGQKIRNLVEKKSIMG